MTRYYVRGYVNNPRWDAPATGEHKPCGYWYQNSILYGTEEETKLVDTYLFGCGYSPPPYGGLGLGGGVMSPLLTEIFFNPVIDVHCGYNHSIVIKSDGTLWGTGNNTYGQLGVNDQIARFYFTQEVGEGTWSQVSCGRYHTVAIKSDGTLWGTGLNTNGQLGLGDRVNRKVFTQISSDSWSFVSAGGDETFAIKSNGSLWATGSNVYGGLGLGDSTRREVLTQVDGSHSYIYASGGYLFSMAIRSDGTLWATGYNSSGQLGIGSKTNKNVLTKVGADTWTKVSCGDGSFTVGINSAGNLFGTGSNSAGQLGLGDLIERTSFEQVGVGIWKDVVCGGGHTLLIAEDDLLYGMGNDGNNELNNVGSGLPGKKVTTPTLISPIQWLKLAAALSYTITLSGHTLIDVTIIDTLGFDSPDDSVWPLPNFP